MPQLIALAALGAAAYFGYKWLKNYRSPFAPRSSPKRTEEDPKDLGNLAWDQRRGVYRPVKDVTPDC
ncbi:MAG: hypothetical protein ACR2PG_16540 [Hyphomicrobiaceae bacterium]